MKENKVIPWLLASEPWIEYRTRIDLLEQSEDTPEVVRSHAATLEHPMIQGFVKELSDWPGHPLKRHNDASHLLHKLVFLADIGVKASDPGIGEIIQSISSHRSNDGTFTILANASASYGGSGRDEWVWMLCDTPSILYALLKMDAEIPDIEKAIGHLANLNKDNGWQCIVSPEMGKFRGPGRKEDPCPYATLLSIKALAQIPEMKESNVCRNGLETILTLWEQRKERKPYLFAMGTDFRKLKAPLIWYDILHVLEVLSRFPSVYGDARFREMVLILTEKADGENRFTAESVWKAWSDWDFGQKKVASPWITFLVYRILKRAGLPLESAI